MRLAVSDCLDGLRRRIRSGNWLTLVEMLALALLVLQGARLLWAVVTPIGSYGAWEGRQAQIPEAAVRQVLFATFDPFFRAGQPASGREVVVTSLALQVYGIRLNEGSGLGSAIIETPDGMQSSFAVGDAILPGVVLKAVAFDHVSIDRGGAEEQIFIDQSDSASREGDSSPSEGEGFAPAEVASAAGRDNPTAESLRRDIGFSPRMQNGQVTGLVLSPKGAGFQNAGFQSGDIVTQVNGRPIRSAGDLQALQNQIVPGARISLMVERGAAVVPIALTLQGQ